MSLITFAIDFSAALFNLFVRIAYLFVAFFSYLFALLAYLPLIFLLVGLSAGTYVAVTYGDTGIEVVEHAFRCSVYPFYQETIRPIVADILQAFYDNFICWWNAFSYVLYGIVREVLFPVASDCGFLNTIKALANFFKVFLKELLIDYVASRKFLTSDFDFTNTIIAWKNFFITWQQLFCFQLSQI